MPKRPPARQQHTMPSFFNEPPRPTVFHTENQRNTPIETSPQPRPVKPLPQPQIKPVPPPPPEPIRPYDVQFPQEPPRPQHNFDSIRQELGQSIPGFEADPAAIIATQKQTISRLLEEAGYMNRALDRLKNIEQSTHLSPYIPFTLAHKLQNSIRLRMRSRRNGELPRNYEHTSIS